MRILKDIIATCDDITYQYSISKAPKFIKDINAKNNFKKVDKIIDKLNSHIDNDIVGEYVEILLEQLPPRGTYKHCKSVKNNNDYYSASFEYNILETKKDSFNVIADIFQTYAAFGKPFSISITVFHNKLKQISFQIALENLIPPVINDANRDEKIATEARIGLINILQKDIVSFMNDYIDKCRGITYAERKERKRPG